jgi:hypothetical protein
MEVVANHKETDNMPTNQQFATFATGTPFTGIAKQNTSQQTITETNHGIVSILIPDFDGFAASHPWMGQKVGSLQTIPGAGYVQRFQAATAYGLTASPVFEVHGAILAKYTALGGPTGFLGFPLTSETTTPDGHGRYNHFQNGSIYWHPSLGAFEIHGAIRSKWASLGWERYGYPMTDESHTFDGTGRFNHFRGFTADGHINDSSIYWSPGTGAHEVHGDIRSTWAGLGWETSFLGYPLSDEYSAGQGRRSDFQSGNITWTTGMGSQVQPQCIKIDAGLTFGTGIPVGGYGSLKVYSDGTTWFSGHLHDSGFPSYDCLAVFTIRDTDGRAYAVPANGRVHGTDETGSRNLDWDLWGTNDDIRKNWAKLWFGGRGGYKADVTSDWTAKKIAEDVAAVAGVVLGIIPLIMLAAAGGGDPGKKASNPNYNTAIDYPAAGVPPPDSGTLAL